MWVCSMAATRCCLPYFSCNIGGESVQLAVVGAQGVRRGAALVGKHAQKLGHKRVKRGDSGSAEVALMACPHLFLKRGDTSCGPCFGFFSA